MLLDVLSGFDELNICTHYQLNGETTDWFPADALDLQHAKPVYETIPGFPESLEGITDYHALPANAKKYIERLEHHIGVPVKIVSIGASRHQTLIRS
jgi:adenylosuccinate synthase